MARVRRQPRRLRRDRLLRRPVRAGRSAAPLRQEPVPRSCCRRTCGPTVRRHDDGRVHRALAGARPSGFTSGRGAPRPHPPQLTPLTIRSRGLRGVLHLPNCQDRAIDADGLEGLSHQAVGCRRCGFGFVFQLLDDYYPHPDAGLVGVRQGQSRARRRPGRVRADRLPRARPDRSPGARGARAARLRDGTDPVATSSEWGVRQLGNVAAMLRHASGREKTVMLRRLPRAGRDGGHAGRDRPTHSLTAQPPLRSPPSCSSTIACSRPSASSWPAPASTSALVVAGHGRGAQHADRLEHAAVGGGEPRARRRLELAHASRSRAAASSSATRSACARAGRRRARVKSVHGPHGRRPAPDVGVRVRAAQRALCAARRLRRAATRADDRGPSGRCRRARTRALGGTRDGRSRGRARSSGASSGSTRARGTTAISSRSAVSARSRSSARARPDMRRTCVSTAMPSAIAVGLAEHHRRGLAADARDPHQLGRGARHLPVAVLGR